MSDDPGELRAVCAALAWVEIDGLPQLVRDAKIWFRQDSGQITRIELADPSAAPRASGLIHDLGPTLLLPGFVNAHSHAFQRAIRGATHRMFGAGESRGDASGGDAPSTFWSWRTAMYAAANRLDPDGVYRETKACFREMLHRGITCVGEFHYLHHDPQGQPYADANELSLQVIRAADEVGLRLCLLEVYYARAGVDHDGPLPEQRRFCDGSTDAYFARLDALRGLARDRPKLALGVAPHSVRAVRGDELGRLAAYANTHALPIHAHVSEQVLENQQCWAEHERTPLRVFADAGCLERRAAFTAVHAIHVDEADLELMRDQQICACPTTEADLGDGIVPAVAWREHGATLALGSDSNAVIDLVQEARALEMHERLRSQSRLCLRDEAGEVAPVLLAAATTGGAAALAQPSLGRLAVGAPFDAVAVDLDHPSLRGVDPVLALDALLLTGSAEPISQVWVAGERKR